MAEYATVNEPERTEPATIGVASPAPLGLSVLAFATAILGCFYASFIVPYSAGPSGVLTAIAAFIIVSGIVLVLAGMWEFRKNSTITATIFTSYGGFLVALGLVFLPNLGISTALASAGAMHHLLGLVFLCWTIFTGILFLGTLRMNISLIVSIGLLFVAFLLLTIGELSGGTRGLLIAGGWVAVACAIISWLAAIASIMSTATGQEIFRIPLGRRFAVVE